MTLSRRKFIALAGGSVASATVLAACGSDSDAKSLSPAEEVDALNDLLTLEYVEAAFYAALIDSKLLPKSAGTTLGKFGEEEEEHVAALVKAIRHLKGDPVPKPKTKFSLTSEDAALELAGKLENTGAGAYLGQLPNIGNEMALATVLSIHSVEGRHAAAVNDLLSKPLTPDGAFAEPVSIDTALAEFDAYLNG